LPGRALITAAALLTLLAALAAAWWSDRPPPPWSDAELALLRGLDLDTLPPPPPSPGNRFADDPGAAMLGARLFFEVRMSGNGQVSCATCHQPALGFTDGRVRARGLGESQRHTPGLLGAAYSPWLYWDGRKDSLWSQALAPIEDPDEHGSDRAAVAALIAADPVYRAGYETVFGPLPELTDDAAVTAVFVNAGKAIAAFQRRIEVPRTRFDDYVRAVVAGDEARARALFDHDEVRGLRLFIGKAECLQCHNGPLLTNHEFHNTGVLSAPGELPDRGRADGLRQLEGDPFNCLGAYSDAEPAQCQELRFARRGAELIGAFRTPTLRHAAQTAPYMHRGQIGDLASVIAHYDEAPEAMIGHNEAMPLGLTEVERRHLEGFLHTLDGRPKVPGFER
jgi:cytochrome c peroxidase